MIDTFKWILQIDLLKWIVWTVIFLIAYIFIISPFFDSAKEDFRNHPDSNNPTGNESQYVQPEETMPWYNN